MGQRTSTEIAARSPDGKRSDCSLYYIITLFKQVQLPTKANTEKAGLLSGSPISLNISLAIDFSQFS